MRPAPGKITRSMAGLVWAAILVVGALAQAQASFRLPWQRTGSLPECARQTDQDGYFRPEYVELVQRLEPATMEWLERTFPELGWQGMDRRVFTPKEIPGSREAVGFRYDTAWRRMELEALFHFGPAAGNGTLIEDLRVLDDRRLVTVNRGSGNLSVIDVKKPDVVGVIQAPHGLQAFDVNLSAGELYLVERGARGLLVFSLADYSLRDTLFLGFEPSAVLKSRGDPYLYLTDEARHRLMRYDLSGGAEPLEIPVDLDPPWLIAHHEETNTIVLAGTAGGQLRLVDGKRGVLKPDRLQADSPLLALYAPPETDALFLASGGCERSTVYRLVSGDYGFTCERVVSVAGILRGLCAAGDGKSVYLAAQSTLYRLDVRSGQVLATRDVGEGLRGVASGKERLFAAGGLYSVYSLDADLGGKLLRTEVEMGPGPLVLANDKLYAANSLSGSITILEPKLLQEEVSVLVGVLLGRAYYRDNRIVVNNVFRHNLLVLDPENYRIEEIIPAGGSLYYNRKGRHFVMFDDSLATLLPSPPSQVAINISLELPGGVRLFSPTSEAEIYLVADQGRYVTRADLGKSFRRGNVPLPQPALGMLAGEKDVYVLARSELYRFGVEENIGLSRTWPARPFKCEPPWLADDGLYETRGSQLRYIGRDRLVDVFNTRGELSVIRLDPDTCYAWVGSPGFVNVFDSKRAEQLSQIAVRGEVRDLYLPSGLPDAYVLDSEQLLIVDRRSLFRRDDISVSGEFVYAYGEGLFLQDHADPRKLQVADGLRGMLYQEIDLPLVPTDAASDGERLFLVGGTQGAIAFYANRIDPARLPRSADRSIRDDSADRRLGYHR